MNEFSEIVACGEHSSGTVVNIVEMMGQYGLNVLVKSQSIQLGTLGTANRFLFSSGTKKDESFISRGLKTSFSSRSSIVVDATAFTLSSDDAFVRRL